MFELVAVVAVDGLAHDAVHNSGQTAAERTHAHRRGTREKQQKREIVEVAKARERVEQQQKKGWLPSCHSGLETKNIAKLFRTRAAAEGQDLAEQRRL